MMRISLLTIAIAAAMVVAFGNANADYVSADGTPTGYHTVESDTSVSCASNGQGGYNAVEHYAATAAGSSLDVGGHYEASGGGSHVASKSMDSDWPTTVATVTDDWANPVASSGVVVSTWAQAIATSPLSSTADTGTNPAGPYTCGG